MDLLLKWLGKESAEHVEQVRAIHINNPQAGNGNGMGQTCTNLWLYRSDRRCFVQTNWHLSKNSKSRLLSFVNLGQSSNGASVHYGQRRLDWPRFLRHGKRCQSNNTEAAVSSARKVVTSWCSLQATKPCFLSSLCLPLRKCRAFRERPIEARKAILKENNVCFKCCSSASHITKNCKIKVQCSECKSERHHTALHPGPVPWIEEVDAAPEHGGKGEEVSPQSRVTSKCTEVCGEDQTDRSCSKICLVKVFPAGHRDKAVKVYAIVDEQNNRSLVRSQFFEVFSDQSPNAPYTLRTCPGVKESAGRRASSYEVKSLDGTVRIPLPSLIECNDIPNNRDEIPTPDVARRHAHLKSVAHLVPEQDPQAPKKSS